MLRDTGDGKCAVFFDLDGTLLDTAADFIACLNALRAHHGFEALPDSRIRPTVSEGAGAMVDVAFSGVPTRWDREALTAEFLGIYSERLADQTRLFPGLDGALSYLETNNVPWGVVTNKPSRFSKPLLEALDLSRRCAVLICPDDVTQRKPHPESLLLAAERLGVSAPACVYIGDHARDIEAGRRAGMTTVAAGWGYVPSPASVQQWGADFDLLDSRALQSWLEQFHAR